VRKLLRGEPLGKPTVSDLLAAEARKEAAASGGARPTPEPPPDIIPPNVIPRPA
jgi:hypothetical protein